MHTCKFFTLPETNSMSYDTSEIWLDQRTQKRTVPNTDALRYRELSTHGILSLGPDPQGQEGHLHALVGREQSIVRAPAQLLPQQAPV